MVQNSWKPYKAEIEALQAKKSSPLSKRVAKKRSDPTERQIQSQLISWGKFNPIVRDYLFSIPNEGKRSRWLGERMKSAGLRPGVSDLFLAWPNGRFHGYFLELKRKGSKPTELQLEWIERMRKVGYAADWCDSLDKAIALLEDYLS